MLPYIQVALVEASKYSPVEKQEITSAGFAYICSRVARGEFSVKEFRSIIEKPLIDIITGK